jgi:hypothetical protein
MDSVANANYLWTGPVNFTSTSRNATRVAALNSTGNYQASVTVFGCQSPVSTRRITVLANPGLPVITVAGNVLTAPGNYVHYDWIYNGDTLDAHTQTITATGSGVYIVVVYNASGCFRASNQRTVTVTAVDPTIENSKIVVYPNPASSNLRISLGSGNPDFIGLFNSLGQIADIPKFEKSNGFINIDIQNLVPGNYWVRFQSLNKTIVVPVVKK